MLRDFLGLYLPAVLMLVVLVAIELTSPSTVDLDSGVATAVVAATGLLSGFLFGLSVTILDKAIDASGRNDAPSRERSENAERLLELAANTAFASIVAGVTTATFIGAELIGPVSEYLTAAGIAGVVLLGTVGAMVIRRVFLETENLLREVRTR